MPAMQAVSPAQRALHLPQFRASLVTSAQLNEHIRVGAGQAHTPPVQAGVVPQK